MIILKENVIRNAKIQLIDWSKGKDIAQADCLHVHTILKDGRKVCLAFRFKNFVEADGAFTALIDGKCKLKKCFNTFSPSPSRIKCKNEIFEQLLI